MAQSNVNIKDFFKINVWHIVILSGWIFSGVWVVAQWKATTEMLSSRLLSVEQQNKEIVKIIDTLKEDGTRTARLHISADDLRQINTDQRILKMEENISKLSVIGNDINWIKTYIMGGDPVMRNNLNGKNGNSSSGSSSNKP